MIRIEKLRIHEFRGIRELTLARLLHSHIDPKQVPVRDIMARTLPTITEDVDLNEVYRLLSSGSSGAVVLRGEEILGVITRIDLVNFWNQPFAEGIADDSGDAEQTVVADSQP